MKHSLPSLIFTLEISALLLASCASKAPTSAQAGAQPAQAAPTQPSAPQKVAKQRTVVTTVPVLVKESTFYSDGLPDEYVVYTLDAAKKNVVKKEVFDPARPDPVQRVLSEYKDGLLSAESVYESDGSLRSRRELSYDSAGRLAQETVFDAKGKAQSGSSYAYDAQGRKAEWRALDGSGAIKAVSDYSYGPSGLGGVDMKDSGGRITGRIKVEYSGDRLSRRSYFGADGMLQKYEAYAYEGGRVASVEYHGADGSLVSTTVYSYGPSGELLKSAELGASGTPGEYTTYEYVVREDSTTETYYE